MTTRLFKIAVDTGGTFTDCIALDNENKIYTCKVLSNSTLRGNIEKTIDAKTFQIKHNWDVNKDIFKHYHFRLLNTPLSNFDHFIQKYDTDTNVIHLNKPLTNNFQIEGSAFEITAFEEAPILAARLITQTGLDETLPLSSFRLGSTKGTNALLERTGAKTAMIVTKGFNDLLLIGNQQRPNLFALQIIKQKPFYTEEVEINERLNADGSVHNPLNINDLNIIIKRLKRKKIESIAISLIHAYRNPAHEKILKKAFEKHFPFVSISSDLSQLIKYQPRTETTVINAYLKPIIQNYLQKIIQKLPEKSLKVMSSAGSLMDAHSFQPKDSLLSGPAGGIVGAANIAKKSGFEKILTFDMGGTSTDVARFDHGFDYCFETSINGATVFAPALNIETVAAGGGSICYFDGYKLCVGPQSAGASPGPACYGAGGPLTITDVHLLLGRLDASQFGIPVFIEKAKEALKQIEFLIVEKTKKIVKIEEILRGFLKIADERMAEAIKKISTAKGYDPKEYALLTFGGAGGLHACNLAQLLDIQSVIIPQYAGLLSAFGISTALMERFSEKQILKTVHQITYKTLEKAIEDLSKDALNKLSIEVGKGTKIAVKKALIYVRLKGQDAAIEVNFGENYLVDFKSKYQKTFGHWVENRAIEIESIRVIVSETLEIEKEIPDIKTLPPQSGFQLDGALAPYFPKPHHFTQSFLTKNQPAIPVFLRDELKEGACIKGFSLVLDKFSTTVVESDFSYQIDTNNTAILHKIKKEKPLITKNDNTQILDLELFTNRFTAIAENMGVMLQRTALSVNVKERLDFSCAILDAEGELIANAPHIPVHLGSLGVCVREVLKYLKIEKGDTIITNHPAYGGSHLPDVTLITGVYFADKNAKNISNQAGSMTEGGDLIGYVCNRCHHAEIGGIRPASMPPNATLLVQEGVIIEPMYLAKNSITDWESITYKLINNRYPTRAIEENLADLKAALASNLNGAEALNELVKVHGLKTIHHYMKKLKEVTTEKLKNALQSSFTEGVYEAVEQMDDGTLLKVKIDYFNDKLTFDFTGCSPVHKGNLNANRAIVSSVVIYILRLLIKDNVPLNEGIMQNIALILPENSILNPKTTKMNENTEGVIELSENYPAVVGGNVETSQRLTDTILKALGIIACGQGTMNNVLFGNEKFGYYETICGGSGAGDGFDGTDAVHTHMTNTRITDPEILEFRYPVRLDYFKIRKNSGGQGLYKGGEGIERKLTFLKPISLSILSQHRRIPPYGLMGGNSGAIGKQYILFENGSTKNLKGIDGIDLSEGDSLIIKTPGGGGWGKK